MSKPETGARWGETEKSEDSTPNNPFLAQVAAERGRPPLPPRKAKEADNGPETRPRRALRPPTYELKPLPGVESPVVKDAHREFRRGGFRKTLGFVAVAVVILGGLTWLVKPEPKAEVPFERLYSPPKQEQFAIGTSLPPDRIVEEEVRHTPDRPTQEVREAPTRPSGIVPAKQFADEFKSRADKTEPPAN
jgi:hypothetical protein